jgi:hypothetical protein
LISPDFGAQDQACLLADRTPRTREQHSLKQCNCVRYSKAAAAAASQSHVVPLRGESRFQHWVCGEERRQDGGDILRRKAGRSGVVRRRQGVVCSRGGVRESAALVWFWLLGCGEGSLTDGVDGVDEPRGGRGRSAGPELNRVERVVAASAAGLGGQLGRMKWCGGA